ncbi:MAG TPA: carboxypeptidase-like regulatory domain-containing protein [Terriglobia bacterium]|nr:carboxypeptidase-like regulatory domain-containing protein [Terriglobia bacterium]
MNTRNGLIHRKYYRQLWLALAVLALVMPLQAQIEASITGTVTDNSGAAIPGATVTVTNIENGFARQVKTDAGGRYDAPSLPLGRYDVTAETTGFKSEVKTGLTLVVGEKALVNLTLQVGEVKQVVTVKDEGPVVNVTSQETSGLVGERQVKELPLNGRSYDELMTLNPGVVNYTGERTGGVGVSNSAVGNMFAVSGRRPQENLFLLNGIEYTGASEINLTPGGTSGELLGVDAVREFNVLSDTYGAEYGKRSGAQVNIVTASGTNLAHGAVYEFMRNSALDARNFFDQGSIPQFERDEFGGALGGPLQKDKTFLFGNYEGFRQDLGLSDVTLVPDDNARLGLLPGSNGTLINVGVAPAVQPFLALWPMQNGPDLGGGIGEAFSHPQQTIREDFGTTRLDHTFSAKDSIFSVYTIDDSADTTPTANPLSLDLESLREQVVSLQETHVFSSTALNTARVGYSRGAYLFNGESLVPSPAFIQGGPVGAIVVGGGTAVNAASQISLAGTNVGTNFVAARNLFTYEDRIDLSKGAHQISTGAWFQRIQANDNMAQGQYGQASFASLTTFLQGTVSTFTAVPSSTLMGWRSLEGAAYFQDAIKLKPNLELTLGLRDEFTNGWNEAHGRASNYLFTNGVINTQPTVGNQAFTVNNTKFLPEPRVGLAWDPFGKGKTVVHAGFGVYYDLLDDLSYRLDQNPPFNTTLTLKNVPISSLNIVPGAPLPSGGLISPAGVQPNAYTPSVVAYTFKIEHQIAPRTLLSIGYAGSRGAHQMLAADTNEPVPTVCPAAPCPATLAAGTVYYPKGAPLANPQLANATTWLSEGESSYNALEVDVNHHFDHGLQLRGVYTYSKSLDDGGAWNSSVAANTPGFVMFPLDPRLDWGLSPFDIRHLAVINGNYDLPFGHGKPFLSVDGWKGKMISGWTASAIETLQSGFPFTPQLGFNPTNNGDSRNPVRPSYNPAFQGNIIVGSPTEYFNPNAFILPASGTYGNVGRDTLIGPGLASLDLSLSKNTLITEKVRLQFRAEFFNILNRANFNTPNAVVYTSATSGPSPTAGVISSTATTSRQIQFGMKLIW